MDKIIKEAKKAGQQKFTRKTPILELEKNREDMNLIVVEINDDQKEINDNASLTLKEMIEKYGLANTISEFKKEAIEIDETKIIRDINEMWKITQQKINNKPKKEIKTKKEIEQEIKQEENTNE